MDTLDSDYHSNMEDYKDSFNYHYQRQVVGLSVLGRAQGALAASRGSAGGRWTRGSWGSASPSQVGGSGEGGVGKGGAPPLVPAHHCADRPTRPGQRVRLGGVRVESLHQWVRVRLLTTPQSAFPLPAAVNQA